MTEPPLGEPNAGVSLEHALHMLGSATWTHTQLDEIGKSAKAKIEGLERRRADVRRILETAVCTKGPDKGVVLLSNDGPTHPEVIDGKTVQVYDHDHFSPLGDALIAAWEKTRSWNEN